MAHQGDTNYDRAVPPRSLGERLAIAARDPPGAVITHTGFRLGPFRSNLTPYIEGGAAASAGSRPSRAQATWLKSIIC